MPAEDANGLGSGESAAVDVYFTTQADTTLMSAVAPYTINGEAPNIAHS
ncbi:MAG: hypothetical protein AAF702_07980 [Chloroflexota bacterium]